MDAWLVAGWDGRDPIGPTDPIGPEDNVRDGESLPPGDEVDVTGCSAVESYRPYDGMVPAFGDDVLLARDGD